MVIGITLDSRARQIAWPYVAFVSALSFLPHKELRFVLFCVPAFNIVAALGLQSLFPARKGAWRRLVMITLTASVLLLSLLASGMFVLASEHNYPGGRALETVHKLVPASSPAHVHVDVLAAVSGVSLFGMDRPLWR